MLGGHRDLAGHKQAVNYARQNEKSEESRTCEAVEFLVLVVSARGPFKPLHKPGFFRPGEITSSVINRK